MTDALAPPAPPAPAGPAVCPRPARGWWPGRGVLAVADQAVVSGASFATSVLVARAWAPEVFGVYSLALGLALVGRAVLAEVVSAPFVVYSPRFRGDDLAGYTGSTLVHYLVLTGVAVVLLLAAAGVLGLGVGPAGAAAAVLAAAGATPFLLLREYARRVDLSRLEVGAVLVTDLTVAAVQLGGLLALRELGLLTVPGAFAAVGAGAAVGCLTWVATRRRAFRVEAARVAPDWKRNWGFARWAVVGFLVGSATPFVLPWVVAGAVGEAATGVFVACVTLVNVAGMYITGVANYLTPRAARAYAAGGVGDLRRVLGRTGALFAVTLGAFAAAVAAAGDVPAVRVYGPAYAGCGTVLAVLAVQVWAAGLGVVAGNGLWAMDRPRANAAADVLAIGVTVPAVLLLLPPLGVLGAAVGALAGTTAGLLLRVGLLLRLMAAEPAAGPEPGAGHD